jgi:hypothetical protein
MTTTKTIGRDLPNGDYVEITAEERDSSGNLSAGFSITLSGWEKRGTRKGRSRKFNTYGNLRDTDYGGADHETILAAAPELAPIVTAHLADPDGTPMHGVANGWYFYTGESEAYERQHYGEEYVKRQGTPHERAARALHIAPEDLPTGLDRDGFAAFCEGLAGRWAGQAQAARDALAAMVNGEGVES